MTSNCLKLNLVLDLCADVFPQFMITLIANYLSIKIPLSCYFCLSTSSHLWYLWSGRYFPVVIHKFLCFNRPSICLSFNYSIPLLSTIVSTSFLSYVSLLISTMFIWNIPQKFHNFSFLQWNKFLMINIRVDQGFWNHKFDSI